MSDTKHTPGPWTVEFFNRTLNGLPWPSKFQPVDVVIGNRRLRVADTPEGDADARLIAAAPKMLAALKMLIEVCPCRNGCAPDDMTCATSVARAAIAEAEGEDMSAMVEKVARALYADRWPEWDWDAASPETQEDYRGHARAAIEAMREPSAMMVNLGARIAADGADCNIDWRTIAQDCYRAMIDAALGPPKSEDVVRQMRDEWRG